MHRRRTDRVDRVVEQSTLWRQEAVKLGEVFNATVEPDMFEHTDARDRVELFTSQVSVVLNANRNFVGEASIFDAFFRKSCLLRGKCDADSFDAVVLRRVHQQATPAAANVEITHSRLEIELAADQVVLR